MKTFYTLIISSVMVGNVSAQKMIQGLGLGYLQNNVTYANSDMVSLNYTPVLLRERGNFAYGFSAPFSLGKIVSSSRESVDRGLFLELPISAEINYKPGPPCTILKSYSMFAGAGLSRVINTKNMFERMDFMNMYLGIRIPPFGKSFEIRMLYSQTIEKGKGNRLGLSVSYLFN